MRILVTGSSGHLGEALVRTLRVQDCEVVGLDILPGATTTVVGSITDRETVARAMDGVQRVFHTATLHKPHVATHTRQQFVDTNVTGTLNVLEEAVAAGVESVVCTSTTSVFCDALVPPPGEPAAWITEDVTPVPKNIYGVTKAAAEDLCQLFHRNRDLPCIVLRTARFFPEADDNPDVRHEWDEANLKVNELLYRRVDIEDVASAHLLAADRAPSLRFGRYIVSATTPVRHDDLSALRTDAASVVERCVPGTAHAFAQLGWRLPSSIDRVYVNNRARRDLGWVPRHGFASVVERVLAGGDHRSALALAIGSKGYHAETGGRKTEEDRRRRKKTEEDGRRPEKAARAGDVAQSRATPIRPLSRMCVSQPSRASAPANTRRPSRTRTPPPAVNDPSLDVKGPEGNSSRVV